MRRTLRSDVNGQMRDDLLQQIISEAMENDPVLGIAGPGGKRKMIMVEVEDGVVTLSGIVRSAAEKRRADILVRLLGATGVDNKLDIEA